METKTGSGSGVVMLMTYASLPNGATTVVHMTRVQFESVATHVQACARGTLSQTQYRREIAAIARSFETEVLTSLAEMLARSPAATVTKLHAICNSQSMSSEPWSPAAIALWVGKPSWRPTEKAQSEFAINLAAAMRAFVDTIIAAAPVTKAQTFVPVATKTLSSEDALSAAAGGFVSGDLSRLMAALQSVDDRIHGAKILPTDSKSAWRSEAVDIVVPKLLRLWPRDTVTREVFERSVYRALRSATLAKIVVDRVAVADRRWRDSVLDLIREMLDEVRQLEIRFPKDMARERTAYLNALSYESARKYLYLYYHHVPLDWMRAQWAAVIARFGGLQTADEFTRMFGDHLAAIAPTVNVTLDDLERLNRRLTELVDSKSPEDFLAHQLRELSLEPQQFQRALEKVYADPKYQPSIAFDPAQTEFQNVVQIVQIPEGDYYFNFIVTLLAATGSTVAAAKSLAWMLDGRKYLANWLVPVGGAYGFLMVGGMIMAEWSVNRVLSGYSDSTAHYTFTSDDGILLTALPIALQSPAERKAHDADAKCRAGESTSACELRRLKTDLKNHASQAGLSHVVQALQEYLPTGIGGFASRAVLDVAVASLAPSVGLYYEPSNSAAVPIGMTAHSLGTLAGGFALAYKYLHVGAGAPFSPPPPPSIASTTSPSSSFAQTKHAIERSEAEVDLLLEQLRGTNALTKKMTSDEAQKLLATLRSGAVATYSVDMDVAGNLAVPTPRSIRAGSSKNRSFKKSKTSRGRRAGNDDDVQRDDDEDDDDDDEEKVEKPVAAAGEMTARGMMSRYLSSETLTKLGIVDDLKTLFEDRLNQFVTVFTRLFGAKDGVSWQIDIAAVIYRMAVIAATESGILHKFVHGWSTSPNGQPRIPTSLVWQQRTILKSTRLAVPVHEHPTFLRFATHLAIYAWSIYASSVEAFVAQATGQLAVATSPKEQTARRKSSIKNRAKNAASAIAGMWSTSLSTATVFSNTTEPILPPASNTVFAFRPQPENHPRVQFGMLYDATLRAIVVVFRGTNSLSDVFTDVDVSGFRYRYASATSVGVTDGFAHGGFLERTLDIFDEVTKEIAGLRRRYPEMKTVIMTGHSLGAAIAGVMTMAITNRCGFKGNEIDATKKPSTADDLGVDVYGVGFATPACMTSNLGHAMAYRFHSIVYSNDIVPTMNPYAIYRFGVRRQLIEPCSASPECRDFSNPATCQTFLPLAPPGTVHWAVFELPIPAGKSPQAYADELAPPPTFADSSSSDAKSSDMKVDVKGGGGGGEGRGGGSWMEWMKTGTVGVMEQIKKQAKGAAAITKSMWTAGTKSHNAVLEVMKRRIYTVHPSYFIDRLDFRQNCLSDHGMGNYLQFVRTLYVESNDDDDVTLLLPSWKQAFAECCIVPPMFRRDVKPMDAAPTNPPSQAPPASLVSSTLDRALSAQRMLDLKDMFVPTMACHAPREDPRGIDEAIEQITAPNRVATLFTSDSPMVVVLDRARRIATEELATLAPTDTVRAKQLRDTIDRSNQIQAIVLGWK